jgi:hypothetical protein
VLPHFVCPIGRQEHWRVGLAGSRETELEAIVGVSAALFSLSRSILSLD